MAGFFAHGLPTEKFDLIFVFRCGSAIHSNSTSQQPFPSHLHNQKKKPRMAEEIYDGAIGIDLGMRNTRCGHIEEFAIDRY